MAYTPTTFITKLLALFCQNDLMVFADRLSMLVYKCLGFFFMPWQIVNVIESED